MIFHPHYMWAQNRKKQSFITYVQRFQDGMSVETVEGQTKPKMINYELLF